MDDLFDQVENPHEPLASRMRPRNLDEYVGQSHIVGKGCLLRRAIRSDQLTSVIFYGPPGTGKTTLARVIANTTSSNFITLNAVLTGVADIRKAIGDAENAKKLYGKKTILFVDEVHRWNKSQQDALLPWVENGTIILIGATTENPFFEVNKALVSRSRVFQLKQLTDEDLMNVAEQTIHDKERGYGNYNVQFEENALEHLVETANGDARSLLNALELAVETTPDVWNPKANTPEPPYGSTIYITKECAEQSIQKKVVLYDKDGDYHYDIISAFIKSLRGRDPDGAMYWLARMVRAGEDPHFIFRRMLISACEDTGLADPNAITVVESCARAFDRVGLPEGRYFLAHAALYLSTAPKSNSSMAFFDALASVEKQDAEVPNHLKDSSRDAQEFGHGSGYLYPHAYRDHWVAQQYLPDALVGKVFYTPTTQGYEATIREEVLSNREVQIATLLGEGDPTSSWIESSIQASPTAKSCAKVKDVESMHHGSRLFHGEVKTGENLTFSPQDLRKESALSKAEKEWRSRLDSNKAENLLLVRNQMIQAAPLLRHHRSLIVNADDGLLVFDITRKTPEGITCGLCKSQKGIEVLSHYSATLEDLDKPHFSLLTDNIFENDNLIKTAETFDEINFDRLYFRDNFRCKSDIEKCSQIVNQLFETQKLDSNAKVVISQRIPCHTQKIGTLIKEQIFPKISPTDIQNEIVTKLEKAEKDFFTDSNNPLFNWDSSVICEIFQQSDFNVVSKNITLTEKRHLTVEEISKWFNKESSYGNAICKNLSDDEISVVVDLLCENCDKNIFDWQFENTFVCVSK